MNDHRMEYISAAISYIETHLHENPDMNTVADTIGYSRYHLHRMFTGAVGLTPHDYIRRRQLSEAAKLLVFSQKPIMEIALISGFESQQAFTTVFKAMYKQTPAKYRKGGFFYPLQPAFPLQEDPFAADIVRRNVSFAESGDLPDWMDFIPLVIDGFPCLEEASHREQVKLAVRQRRALIMRDRGVMIGAAAFSGQAGHIDFLAAHPRYRHCGVMETLLDFMACHIFSDREISITTFREGDRADTGWRAGYRRLGFVESELLTEFGYPTQRMVLSPEQEKRDDE